MFGKMHVEQEVACVIKFSMHLIVKFVEQHHVHVLNGKHLSSSAQNIFMFSAHDM